jgi:polar amino acid transport system substrate-binding protein
MIKKNNFKKNTVFYFTIFISFIFLTSFLAFSKSDAKSKKVLTKIEKIKNAGKIVVGTSADYPPYEFHLLNSKEEEIVGLDIDIAKVIAEKLGVKLEIKDITFSKLINTLDSEEVDIVIAGLTPTEKRKKVVDFSEVYYQAIQNMLIRVEDTEKITCIADLRGKKVGTQKGSIQEDIARSKISGAEFIEKETINELITHLKNGDIDAIIVEKPVAESYVLRNKSLINIECKAEEDVLGSAIAVKKGNSALLNKINEILQDLKKEHKIIEFVKEANILMGK